ncbi:MAG: M20/M25/M40 family metallo-hydrolase [Candidatus Acidiferrales bacterium]
MGRNAAQVCALAILAALLLTASGSLWAQVPGQAPAATGFDISKLSLESIAWLQSLIRINTTNPPGNELAAAKYLKSVLDKEGVPTEIFESTPGRGILVARLQAGPVPDPSKALLLMGHLDVVGVDKNKWSVDPFAAVIKDGYLYGRGTIDDKGATAANVAVIVALKRSSARLNRDVIVLAEGDEEQGGETGMIFAVQKHWDKVASGYALNEEGRVMVKGGKVQYIGVQATEKVPVNIQVIASGTSGHASVPRPDNPVAHLAAAIAKIATYQAPVEFNTITRQYFEGLSKVEDEETGKWMRALDTSDRGEHAARYLSQADPVWNSMMRDTVAPTMLQAGIRPNVVPSEARGTLNVRLLPGNMADPLVAKLRELVNDPQVRLEASLPVFQPAPSTSIDTDLYRTIGKVGAQVFPGAVELPMMSTGATDSAQLRLRNVQAYGLLPFPLPQEEISRMHADDERISLDSYRKGVEFLYRIVEDFAVAK